MKPRTFYSLQQAGRETDICIFGDIVTDRYSAQDTSAYSLSQELKDLDTDVINVYIDSYGGAVSEGWAIYNHLRQHPARVRTYGMGFVASAALYPFLAGDERYAVEPSAYFLHQVMAGAEGYASDLRAAADAADQMTEIGLAPFRQAGIDLDEVRAMMRNETWLSPQEALACGIATGVVTNRPDGGMVQSAKAMIIQRVLSAKQDGASGLPAEDPADQPPVPPAATEDVPKPSGIMRMLGGAFKF